MPISPLSPATRSIRSLLMCASAEVLSTLIVRMPIVASAASPLAHTSRSCAVTTAAPPLPALVPAASSTSPLAPDEVLPVEAVMKPELVDVEPAAVVRPTFPPGPPLVALPDVTTSLEAALPLPALMKIVPAAAASAVFASSVNLPALSAEPTAITRLPAPDVEAAVPDATDSAPPTALFAATTHAVPLVWVMEPLVHATFPPLPAAAVPAQSTHEAG